LVLVIEKDNMIIGYMKAFTSRFKCLAHVLTDATLMIHPDYQKFGYGAKLFIKFLDTIKNNMLHIMKFEILPHDSNKFAVQMYEKLGFKMELKNENRIRNYDGNFGSELLMSWINPNFCLAKLNKYYAYLIDRKTIINKYKAQFLSSSINPLDNIQEFSDRIFTGIASCAQEISNHRK
jgi:hypothetical protein